MSDEDSGYYIYGAWVERVYYDRSNSDYFKLVRWDDYNICFDTVAARKKRQLKRVKREGWVALESLLSGIKDGTFVRQ